MGGRLRGLQMLVTASRHGWARCTHNGPAKAPRRKNKPSHFWMSCRLDKEVSGFSYVVASIDVWCRFLEGDAPGGLC